MRIIWRQPQKRNLNFFWIYYNFRKQWTYKFSLAYCIILHDTTSLAYRCQCHIFRRQIGSVFSDGKRSLRAPNNLEFSNTWTTKNSSKKISYTLDSSLTYPVLACVNFYLWKLTRKKIIKIHLKCWVRKLDFDSLAETKNWSSWYEIIETSGRLHPLRPQNKQLHTQRITD